MAPQLETQEQSSGLPSMGRPLYSALQPKGSCWYCDAPVDNVRRFCSPGCRTDFMEEEASHFVAAQSAGSASA